MRLPEKVFQLILDPEVPNEVLLDAIQEFDGGKEVANIFVVRGAMGEYSDFQQWDVAAFLTLAPAESLVRRLTRWTEENDVHLPTPEERRARRLDNYYYERIRALRNPLDPYMPEIWATDGVDYKVFQIPLRGE